MSNAAAGIGTQVDDGNASGRTLSGRMVLAIVAGFFATVGTVNAVMIRYAVTSFRGQVAEHPYEAGLAFNAEIAAAREQASRHWKVDAHIDATATPRAIRVVARDERGDAITGLRLKAEFAAPVNNRVDRNIELEERQGGTYEAIVPVNGGTWDVAILAAGGDQILVRSRSRIRID